ncbi:MAG: GNAT family N-acetyltransferase [Anaerolineae bacterium]|nr:GNAT family N-acetyltransferase [Anaerolineae bacterium]
MVEFELLEALPSPEEYADLVQAVGWGTRKPDVVEKALPNSLYGVCAYVGSEIVGMARIIGDDGLVYYVQDVVVRPEYQGQGIGTAMMDKIMAYIQAHASENSVIGLMAAKGKEGLYQRYGFTRRPNDRLGCGMTMFWSREAQ